MIDLNAVRDGLAHFGSLNMEAVKQAGERFNREVDAHIERAARDGRERRLIVPRIGGLASCIETMDRPTEAQQAAHRLTGYTTDYLMWDDWSMLHLDNAEATEAPTWMYGRRGPPEPPPVRMGRCAALEGTGWRWRGRFEGSGTAEGV